MSRFSLAVAGMSCRNCEHVLTDRLMAIAGVDAVNADHAAGELVVVGSVDRSTVEQAVAGAGYVVRE